MVSFLVDILRFEADRSSKVAIFGLWIVSNSIFGWRESLWLVAKKKRKKSNKLAWFYYMHTPFVRKIVSNPSTCLFVQRFFYERKCRFIENIFRPLCSHFVRLSSPTHSLFTQKKSFYGKRQITWHYISRAGSIVENLPRCSLMDRLLLCDRSQFRNLHFHEPIMVLIMLYIGQEPIVSAVAQQQNR